MLHVRGVVPEVVLFVGIASFLLGGAESVLLVSALPFSLAFYYYQDKERQKTITNEQIEELTEAVKTYTEGTNETLKKALLELEETKSITSKNSLAIGMSRK